MKYYYKDGGNRARDEVDKYITDESLKMFIRMQIKELEANEKNDNSEER